MIPYYYGDDLEYANKRLQNTVVYSAKVKDLFYISLVHKDLEKGVTVIGTLLSDPDKQIEVPVDEIDLEPIPLGYVFLRKKNAAAFISRIPLRSAYRQGLTLSCMNIGPYSKSDFSYKDLDMAAFNDYPTLYTVKKLIKKVYSMPFSRHFALENSGNILYRGKTVVGKLDANEHPILSSNYGYLQQHLDAVVK